MEDSQQRLTTTRSLLLAAGCLALQAVLSGFGVGSDVGTWLWFAAGFGLLWLVHRWHSAVALWTVVAVSGLGVLLTGTSTVASELPPGRGVLLVLAYGATAALLLRPAVRQHVREAPDP